ncbi:MAG: DHH family phosphoesterase [Nanoarchaeota archaeon]|nr:DHH family phosphoesterase [Nanoarchaeota archaeon]
MLKLVGDLVKEFLFEIEKKPIRIISSNSSIGIISSAILIKTLTRLDKKFSLKTMKSLDTPCLKEELKKSDKEVILLVDLKIPNFNDFENIKSKVFVINNENLKVEDINNENLRILNPNLTSNPEENYCNSAGITYIISKEISSENKNLSKIALIGLIGEKSNIKKSLMNDEILKDSKGLKIKKGLTLYPSTRPLKRALEWSVSPYIPGVTGNPAGVIDLLKESKIGLEKNLIDLNEDEMSRLITAVMLRKKNSNVEEEIVGSIYSLKLFDGIEDLREISVLLDTCSKLGETDTAIAYCLENEKAKVAAQDLYTRYKQELITGLRMAESMEKIDGKGFVILNAKDKIKDTIFRTVLSMLSNSSRYSEGTILIGMAYNQDKIQIQTKMIGKVGRSLKELLEKTVINLRSNTESEVIKVGGHKFEAACIVEREKEESFIEALKKNLEIEIVRI